MGKVYQFPNNDKEKERRIAAYNQQPDKELIYSLINTLIETYEQRINELIGYRQEITKENNRHFKGPRELLKQGKYLHEMLTRYGIASRFFRFYTLQGLEVIYYTKTPVIDVIKQQDSHYKVSYTVGEFIAHFEGYPFTVNLDNAFFEIFDEQISRLETTIDTLKNTHV